MATFFSNYNDYLEEILTQMKSLKLEIYPGENVTYFYAETLVDAEWQESARVFKPEHLGYITRIFEDTSDSRLHLWAIQKYK